MLQRQFLIFFWINWLSDSLFRVNNVFWLPSCLSFPQPCQQLPPLPPLVPLPCSSLFVLFCDALSLSRVICVTMGLVIPNQASGLTIPYTSNIMTLPPSVSLESSTCQKFSRKGKYSMNSSVIHNRLLTIVVMYSPDADNHSWGEFTMWEPVSGPGDGISPPFSLSYDSFILLLLLPCYSLSLRGVI